VNAMQQHSQLRVTPEKSPSQPRVIENTQVSDGHELIGSILIKRHRLDASALPKILAEQLKNRDMKFGEIAVKLNLCTEHDLRLSLTEQQGSGLINIADSRLHKSLVCAFTHSGPYVQTITELRYSLLLNAIDSHRSVGAGGSRGFSLALISPCAKDGRSITAANLAISFAQLGRKTLIVDADVRGASQGMLFGLTGNGSGLTNSLQRNLGEAIVSVNGFSCLDILTTGPKVSNPQDLFGRPEFSRALRDFETNYDVVIVDTPASSIAPESAVIARFTHGALSIARDAKTDGPAFDKMQSRCQQLGVNLIGSVMLGN
jgi:protein-tyrosine kinase